MLRLLVQRATSLCGYQIVPTIVSNLRDLREADLDATIRLVEFLDRLVLVLPEEYETSIRDLVSLVSERDDSQIPPRILHILAIIGGSRPQLIKYSK